MPWHDGSWLQVCHRFRELNVLIDYITEKYFWNLQYNIVPIVMDLNGIYAKMVPAGSFINALNFPTVKALADYLKVLDKNDDKYNEYFWWKKHYVLGSSSDVCELCSKLHNPSHPVTIQKNLMKWWHYDATCKNCISERISRQQYLGSNGFQSSLWWTVASWNRPQIIFRICIENTRNGRYFRIESWYNSGLFSIAQWSCAH